MVAAMAAAGQDVAAAGDARLQAAYDASSARISTLVASETPSDQLHALAATIQCMGPLLDLPPPGHDLILAALRRVTDVFVHWSLRLPPLVPDMLGPEARQLFLEKVERAFQVEEALDQMVDLAIATDSLYDPLELGSATEPLVFHWTGAGNDPTFQETIVDAIEGMLDGVEYQTVTAEVIGIPSGLTAVVSPPSQGPVTVGSVPECLDFTVEITGSVPASTVDQSFPMTLEIVGDGSTVLGTEDLTVTVPASL